LSRYGEVFRIFHLKNAEHRLPSGTFDSAASTQDVIFKPRL
jgi:hypothetical protein